MRIKHFILSIAAVAASLTGIAAERMVLSPERCEAGKDVTVHYTPLPSMAGDRTMRGVAYAFTSRGEWDAQDIALSRKGGEWTGVYRVPEATGFVAFKFVGDSITDNNGGAGFCTMVNKGDGRPWPGGYAAWGLMRSSRYGRSIPGYIDFGRTQEVSDSVVYYWINNEIGYNPSTAVQFAPLFAQSARAANIAGSEERIRKALAYLEKTGTEEALMQGMKIVQYSDTAEYGRLGRLVLEKYPKGLMAMKDRYFRKFNTGDGKAIKDHFTGFMEEYPYTPERAAFLANYRQSYDNVVTSILLMDAINGNYDALDTMLDKLSFNGAVNLFYKMIEIQHARNPESDPQLLAPARKIVAHIEATAGERPADFSYLSPLEWKMEADKSIEGYMSPAYSEILRNTGNWEEALKYSRLAQRRWQYKHSAVNENMAEILAHFGLKDELRQLLAKSVYYNQMSDSQMALLRKLYAEEKGSDAGFDIYLASLKNPEDKSNILKEIEKYRVSGKMPEWTLELPDGKLLRSAQMKGKVYVIDFWANWCKPCKASLPGMKKAADHYKGDKGVEFLFVDTQEMTPNYKETAAKYLKSKGLDINLVFDRKGKGAKTNEVLSRDIMQRYSTSGIPMKVVVDAAGNIRFLAVGYGGSPSALFDEMVEMVEAAKKPL